MTERTLITAAVEQEVKPLLRAGGFGREGEGWTAGAARIVLTGMGPLHAGRAVERAIEAWGPARVMSIGVAGGLRAGLGVGDVIVPGEVVEAEGGRVWRPTAEGVAMSGHRMVTGSAICGTAEAKRELAARWDADAVDMETATIARVCEARGVAWLSVRAISDDHEHAVPAELGAMVREDGMPDLRAIAWWAMRRPARASALARLGRDTAKAAEALSRAVMRIVG